MKNRAFHAGMILLLLSFIIPFAVLADDASISDILLRPAHYWNMQVTLVGEVRDVQADPIGTIRGTYTLLDDSCPNPITVRSKDLPPVGRVFRVTGTVLQVSELGNVPVLKELDRTDVNQFSEATRNLLIGLGAVLLILIVVFVVLLLKPKKNAAPSEKAGAGTAGADPGDGVLPTVAIPMPAEAGGETQLLQNPLAELLVEAGSDQGTVFTISKNANAIGRAGTRCNEVVLTDNTVSKEQATLFFDPGSNRFSIVNETTKNPTKVNGVIAGQQVQLSGGDMIEMGKTALRFKIL
ncbi:MAG TPA: FHA domain-containing protein [Candidatus Binatia bacterium]|nr:FHA domain-containing protein [Candidatus Binatia bacterium]